MIMKKLLQKGDEDRKTQFYLTLFRQKEER